MYPVNMILDQYMDYSLRELAQMFGSASADQLGGLDQMLAQF